AGLWWCRYRLGAGDRGDSADSITGGDHLPEFASVNHGAAARCPIHDDRHSVPFSASPRSCGQCDGDRGAQESGFSTRRAGAKVSPPGSGMTEIVRTEGLSKRFGGIVVADRINLQLNAGEAV